MRLQTFLPSRLPDRFGVVTPATNASTKHETSTSTSTNPPTPPRDYLVSEIYSPSHSVLQCSSPSEGKKLLATSDPMSPSLNTVPNELVLLIATALREDLTFEDRQICRSLASLARTSRRFHGLVNPILYTFDAGSVQSIALPWAIRKGLLPIVKRVVESGVDVYAHIRSRKPFFRASQRSIISVDDEGRPPSDDIPTPDYLGKQLLSRGITNRTPDDELAKLKGIPATNQQNKFDFNGDMWDYETMDSDDGHDSLGAPDDEDECRSTASKESILGAWEATPLHIACLWQRADIVAYLLAQNIDIDAQSRGVCSCMEYPICDIDLSQDELPLWSPLHTAICSSPADDMTIPKMLLDAGANICTELSIKETALHTTALLGRVDLMRHLTDQRFVKDVDIKDDRGCTPLHYAFARSNYCRTIPFLLEHGANIDEHIDARGSPLAAACYNNRYGDALTLLDLGADMKKAYAPTERGTLLHACFFNSLSTLACSATYEEQVTDNATEHGLLVDRLLAGGVDPNRRNNEGNTALMLAARSHCIKGARKLLAAGAKATSLNSEGASPITFACTPPPQFPTTLSKHAAVDRWEMEAIEMVKLFVAAGSILDRKDIRGRTTFHTLCERGPHLSNLLVRYLIENGADPASKDKRGETVFRSALLKGSLEICDLLLRHPKGIDPLLPKEAEKLLDAILSTWDKPKWDKQFDYALDLSMGPDTKVDDIFIRAVQAKKWPAVVTMLKRGLVPRADRVQVNPFTDLASCQLPRHHAAMALAALVELGYDINGRNSEGNTPLAAAIQSDDTEVAKHLLELGAKVHLGDMHKRPINIAIRKGRSDLVELLLKYTSLKPGPGIPQNYLHNAIKKMSTMSVLPHPGPLLYPMLLDAGADPNYRDPYSENDTPLMVLLRWGQAAFLRSYREKRLTGDNIKEAVKKFHAKKVDINIRNDEGESAADMLLALKITHPEWFAGNIMSAVFQVVPDPAGAKGDQMLRVWYGEQRRSGMDRTFDEREDLDDDDVCPCGSCGGQLCT